MPQKKDKLLLFITVLEAGRRKTRGLKLKCPETVAYVSAAVLERNREVRNVNALFAMGRNYYPWET